jgi:hypothetical protein
MIGCEFMLILFRAVLSALIEEFYGRPRECPTSTRAGEKF